MQRNKAEYEYYLSTMIDPSTKSMCPNLHEVKNRTSDVFFEPFSARPQDIFFFSINFVKYVGRKTLSTLSIENKITGTKDSRIMANMLLGIFEREQHTDQGVLIMYKSLLPTEKLGVFEQLKQDPMIELYFPFPFLNTLLQEDVCDVSFWNPTPEQVSSLNAGESHIRRYTQHLLSHFNLMNKKIYDPACSTGEFLSAIKSAYPKSYCIGQDLNPEMAAYATKHGTLDEVYTGNANTSPVKDESVDFIFFRFLNLEVVSSKTAHELFATIGNRCKNGGYIILLGHTPILLSVQWFQKLGLQIEQTLGQDGDCVFQYYVLKKIQPIPTLTYEDNNMRILTSANVDKKHYGLQAVSLFNPSKKILMSGNLALSDPDVLKFS